MATQCPSLHYNHSHNKYSCDESNDGLLGNNILVMNHNYTRKHARLEISKCLENMYLIVLFPITFLYSNSNRSIFARSPPACHHHYLNFKVFNKPSTCRLQFINIQNEEWMLRDHGRFFICKLRCSKSDIYFMLDRTG